MQWYDVRQILLIVSGSSCEDQYTELYTTQFCLHAASQTLYYRNDVITTICLVSALSYAALLLAKYFYWYTLLHDPSCSHLIWEWNCQYNNQGVNHNVSCSVRTY